MSVDPVVAAGLEILYRGMSVVELSTLRRALVGDLESAGGREETRAFCAGRIALIDAELARRG
jgi:hypothetical protein